MSSFSGLKLPTQSLLKLIVVIYAAMLPGQSFAIVEKDRHAAAFDTVFFEAKECQGVKTTAGSSELTTVPEPLAQIATDAGNKFHVPPALVAAIYYVENNGKLGPDVSKYKFRDPAPPYGKGAPWPTSSAGANGPFQFLSGTWSSFKQDGSGDGKEDILDLKDAAFGAAKYLAYLGAKLPASDNKIKLAAGGYEAGHPTGGLYADSAFALYKHFGGNSTSFDKTTTLNPFVNTAYAADAAAAADSSGSVPSGYELPQDSISRIYKLKNTYESAAEKTNVPWALLAAIHYREANNDPHLDLGAGNPIGGGGGKYSTQGPSGSLEESAVKAGNQLQDAAKNSRFKRGLDGANPDPELVKDVLFSYNGRADVYAQQAAKYGFDPKTQPYEGSPYVMSKYDDQRNDMPIITTDFGPIGGVDPRPGAFVVYVLLGGADGNTGDCGGSTGGLGVGQGGFVFPLKTTQKVLKRGVGGLHWCYDSKTSCHHDNPDGSKDTAADIFAPTGTPVLAAVSGTVTWIAEPNPKSGERHGGWPQLNIKGDDGNAYFYCHWGPKSLKVHVGQHVKAGGQLGAVGTTTDTGNGSTQHLHFDITPHASSRGPDTQTRTDPQPMLVDAFNKLPPN